MPSTNGRNTSLRGHDENGAIQSLIGEQSVSTNTVVDLLPFNRRKNKKPTWIKYIFGIGPEFGDIPSSKLIYPLSPFGVAWLFTTGCNFWPGWQSIDSDSDSSHACLFWSMQYSASMYCWFVELLTSQNHLLHSLLPSVHSGGDSSYDWYAWMFLPVCVCH